MKTSIYSLLFTCATVVFFYVFGDSLPKFFNVILWPGFAVAVMINGSLHDRVIPGFAILGVAINCLLYCALVLSCVRLFGGLPRANKR